MKFTASWIWHPDISGADNFYLYARRTFELAAVPASARLHITACCLYKLYVNGVFIGRGPNPADPAYYFFDTYEVTAWLKPGQNLIAVIAYNYGSKPRSCIEQNYGPDGLLVQLDDAGGSRQAATKPLLASDATWRVIESPAWDRNSALNNNLYGDFKETFDARREPAGWNADPAFDDSAWLSAEVMADHPIPPASLLPRQIPFLDGPRCLPRNAYWESASVTASWQKDWEIYNEGSLATDHLGVNATHPAKKPLEVFKTHTDFSPAVLLDFGTLRTGYPEIHVASAPGGGTIDVLYGEDPFLVRIDRFHLKESTQPQVLAPFNRRTFRYMKLLFAETPAKILIQEVALEQRTFPVPSAGSPQRGAFACSDELVNRIYDTAVYTIQLSMLDHFVDCPGRERTIYGGDVYNENVHAYYAFGDSLVNRKTLRQMFALQYPAGALPPFGPYREDSGFYAMWSAFFGLAYLDDYTFTADRAFLDELYPRFVRLVDWAIAECDRTTPHLIGFEDRRPAEAPALPGNVFERWSAMPKVSFDLRTNGPFYALIKRAADLARALGRTEEAQRFAAGAERLGGEIHKYLIDPTTGLARNFCTQPAPKGQYSPGGQAENAELLWSCLLSRPQGAHVAAQIFDPALHHIDTPFFALFLGEGVLAYDHSAGVPAGLSALNFLRHYYGDMLRRGATTFWEHFSLDWPLHAQPDRQASLCHGWSAAPAYLLPAYVLGIRPLEPGFARALVAPQLADLSWASGAVPTPHGPIRVRWERTAAAFRLNLETPVPARVTLPALDGRSEQSFEVQAGRYLLPPA